MKRYIRSTIQDITQESSDVLLKVARDTRTRPEVLDKLVHAPNIYDNSRVIDAVAANPNTSPDTLKYLLSYPGIFVHESVASNPSTPLELLDWIVENSKWSWVRQAARHARSQRKKQSKQKLQRS